MKFTISCQSPFECEQPHHRINENQPWNNTIAINLIYIDRVEDIRVIWSHTNIRTPASGVTKFTI